MGTLWSKLWSSTEDNERHDPSLRQRISSSIVTENQFNNSRQNEHASTQPATHTTYATILSTVIPSESEQLRRGSTTPQSFSYQQTLPAKTLKPVSGARGEELIVTDQPWHPGQNRCYGHYKCTCGAWWESGNSWADETQDCKQCGQSILPHKQEPLSKHLTEDRPLKAHQQALCAKCQKLGHLCAISMEFSKKNPQDIYIKGLPADMTEEKLKVILRPYGPILRLYLARPKEGATKRYAFVTFQNPTTALARFNQNSSQTNAVNDEQSYYQPTYRT